MFLKASHKKHNCKTKRLDVSTLDENLITAETISKKLFPWILPEWLPPDLIAFACLSC